MAKTIITKNFSETQKLGKEIAHDLINGGVIALYGDLGSGKTTFTQGLAMGLGIKKKIISPTFIIMRSYNLPVIARPFGSELMVEERYYEAIPKNFFHIDLYRIKNEKDIEELGITEILNDPGNIVVIEWPEKIKNFLPAIRTEIFFEYLDENKRKIQIINKQ